LPAFRDLETWELPWDFVYLLKQAIYEDYTREVMEIYSSVPKPPKKILAEPVKFNRWTKWAKNYKPRKDGMILPFGYGKMCDDENDYYESWG